MKVFFEPTGFSGYDVILSIFVKPQKDGSGYHYSPDGSLHQYWWAIPGQARVFDSKEIPADLWYSIRHGVQKVKVPDDKTDTWTWDDVIYDKIEKEWIRALKKVDREIDNVQTLEDFKKLYPTIKKSHVYSQKVMNKMFQFYGLHDIPVVNGEIGIATYKKSIIYDALLAKSGLEKDPKEELLKVKHIS